MQVLGLKVRSKVEIIVSRSYGSLTQHYTIPKQIPPSRGPKITQWGNQTKNIGAKIRTLSGNSGQYKFKKKNKLICHSEQGGTAGVRDWCVSASVCDAAVAGVWRNAASSAAHQLHRFTFMS